MDLSDALIFKRIFGSSGGGDVSGTYTYYFRGLTQIEAENATKLPDELSGGEIFVKVSNDVIPLEYISNVAVVTSANGIYTFEFSNDFGFFSSSDHTLEIAADAETGLYSIFSTREGARTKIVFITEKLSSSLSEMGFDVEAGTYFSGSLALSDMVLTFGKYLQFR